LRLAAEVSSPLHALLQPHLLLLDVQRPHAADCRGSSAVQKPAIALTPLLKSHRVKQEAHRVGLVVVRVSCYTGGAAHLLAHTRRKQQQV